LKRIPLKAAIASALVIILSGLIGCVGIVEGVRSQKILADEQSRLRDCCGNLLGAGPFSFPVEGSDKAVLLIHGFGGTPFDLRPLGEYLSKKGIASYGVLLPGHGTSVLDLQKTGWHDWVSGPEKALGELTAKYKEVYIAGFSMGGAIAVHLAARHNVAGVILLAPCVYIKGQDKLVTPEYSIKHLARFMMTDYIINDRMQAFDFSMLGDRPFYHLFPITSLRELVALEETARAEIPEVKEPVLVIQSKGDPTVDAKGPPYLVSHLPGHDAEVYWVERSRHLLALDADREQVFKKTYEFIVNH
jgi:carboxylesterase